LWTSCSRGQARCAHLRRSPSILLRSCLIEPVTVEETGPARLQDPDPVDDRALPTRDEASPSSFHEIGGGAQGRITHDYRDFGQFEHNPSPAAEAVKKVRRKIIARQGQEKPSHLLDWVD
jgi:hypothetical protein